MTTKQFNRKRDKLLKQFKAVYSDVFCCWVVDSRLYGKVRLNVDYIPKIKVASLNSIIETDKIDLFKENVYSHISHAGKCNFYSNDPEEILEQLENYLKHISDEKIHLLH